MWLRGYTLRLKIVNDVIPRSTYVDEDASFVMKILKVRRTVLAVCDFKKQCTGKLT
jgi:hypothetical protein